MDNTQDNRARPADLGLGAGNVGFLIKEFDEAGYLKRYPDIARSVASSNGQLTGKLHYERHGRNEGRRVEYLTSRHSLFHLHVPKTAGSSLRIALLKSGKTVLNINPRFNLPESEHLDVDVFSGHAGYRLVTEDKANRLKTITILRDPIDRLLSYYYHLVKLHDNGIEISERTQLAAKYGVDDFFLIKDHPHLMSDMYNAMLWQLLYGTDVVDRMSLRRSVGPLTESDLVDGATRNLFSFLLVGFQDRVPQFLSNLNTTCGVQLSLGQENSNERRPSIAELSAKTLRRIEEWVQLDMEVYKRARLHYL